MLQMFFAVHMTYCCISYCW